ncbi:MAG: DUF1848 domain-containing protein [Oscillospiraceae bacterium]|nr:DUF1848 domain-containing protein [Oscillospiraceae bacterium]
MIISASRRTDIPSYYSEWFLNRLKEGYVCVRNPMNIHQVSKIDLSPDIVDGIVFWTKNPTPMLERIHELDEYTYYFQFTLNSYGKDVERNVPSKNDVIIPAFKKLSSIIGKERVVWRYDPILINDHYSIEYHKKYFQILCNSLSKYTEKCTVSFVDLYKNTERNTRYLNIHIPSNDEVVDLMENFSIVAKENGIYIDTCAEEYDLSSLKIDHACCIDQKRLERIGNYKLNIGKDKNQRGVCGCVESIDIGMYNTCKNGCMYCYANFNHEKASKNYLAHNPLSSLICGNIECDDKINIRKVQSNIDGQLNMF